MWKKNVIFCHVWYNVEKNAVFFHIKLLIDMKRHFCINDNLKK